jgi:hypothetical protein
VAAGLKTRLKIRRTVGGLVVVALLVAGCGIAASTTGGPSFPASSVGPSIGTTTAVTETRAAVAAALAAKSLQLGDPRVPFRPPESARLAAAARAVYQVVLPADPAHGFVSVYEFPDAAAAATAGKEQADYVASGPGRVQFPVDTRFLIRQLGTTIVFYAWSPENSPDPRTPDIQSALETLGTAIAVPR